MAWKRPPARWNIQQSPPLEEIEGFAHALNTTPLVARVLISRGLDLEAAKRFLSPSLDSLFDPFLLRDMACAADRIMQAIRQREPILLYGDYDVDGTSSVVILKKAIELLGGSANFHIPHRLNEGYGMRNDIVDLAASNGIKLIVSVDTGIREREAVLHARRQGIDVIVTDHHLPEADLPPALAVLNPNRPDCSYPNKDLCGAGVTLKLVHALLIKNGMGEKRRTALLDSFLKLAAIATVADIVSLTGENRVIVKRGLTGMRQVRNPGLLALMKVSGLEAGLPPSAHEVAFRLAPRINAAGRMSAAKEVIDLFLTDNPTVAGEIAGRLDSWNRERQQAEGEIVETLLRECEQMAGTADQAAFVFAREGWHLGVLGIVASRLVERLCRPVFVLSHAASVEPGLGLHFSGSGRSVPAFHLLNALETMPELFLRFGGHHQAAGVTISADKLAEFQTRFQEHALGILKPEDYCPTFKSDADASFSEINDESVSQLQRLGPFGFGNPAPVFRVKEAELVAPPKPMGEGNHFSLPLREGGRTLFCKAWNFGDRKDLLVVGTKLNLLIQVEDDAYSRSRGYSPWRVSVKDVQAAESVRYAGRS